MERESSVRLILSPTPNYCDWRSKRVEMSQPKTWCSLFEISETSTGWSQSATCSARTVVHFDKRSDMLENRCQSTIIKKKQMGEVKIYMLISLTHGQAVRKTQRNKKNWYLLRAADQVPFPKLSVPPIWHQRSRTSLFDLHLASAFFLAYQHSWFVTTILFPMSLFLTALFMPLLSPFESSFFSSPPEAFTQICNKNLKFRRQPRFLSLAERKLSNQLLVISTFFSKHRIVWWFPFVLWKKEGRGHNLIMLEKADMQSFASTPQVWVPGSLRATEMRMSRGDKELDPEQQRHNLLNPPAARGCSLTWALLR